MDYNTFKLITTIVSWLTFPFLGVFVGLGIGILYRKANIYIVRGKGKLLPVEVGALIGFGIAIGAITTSILVWPAFWEGINIPMMYVREIIGFSLYILLIDIISIKIANTNYVERVEEPAATPE